MADAKFVQEDEDRAEQGSFESLNIDSKALDDYNTAVRVLDIKQMVGMIYFGVCGGVAGSEGLVGGIGPGLGLLLIVVYPVVIGLPVMLCSAELSSAFPNAGGFVWWVRSSFGYRVGFIAGIWNYLGMLTDTALYPTMFVSYTMDAVPGSLAATLSGSYPLRVLVKICFSIVFNIAILKGVETAGRGIFVAGIIVLSPLVLLTLWGFLFSEGTMDWGRLAGGPDPNADSERLVTYLNMLYWSFSAFDQASLVASDVKNPQKTYPKASFYSLVLIISTYLFPLMVAAGVVDDWRTIKEGSIVNVARIVGGETMTALVFISTLVSCAGLFLTTMLETIFLLLGMSEAKMAPRVFQSRSKANNVPNNAAYLTMGICLTLCLFDFGVILRLTNIVSAASMLLEVMAVIKLRVYDPDLDRPYRVPIDSRYGIIIFLLPCLLMNVLFMLIFFVSNPWILVTFIIVTCLSLLLSRCTNATIESGNDKIIGMGFTELAGEESLE